MCGEFRDLLRQTVLAACTKFNLGVRRVGASNVEMFRQYLHRRHAGERGRRFFEDDGAVDADAANRSGLAATIATSRFSVTPSISYALPLGAPPTPLSRDMGLP